LIPRLRAVDSERVSPYKDESRFDSGAFGPRLLPPVEAQPAQAPTAPEHSSPAVQEAAARRAPEESHPSAETADLLEALRRRRGQRGAAPLFEENERADASRRAGLDAGEEDGTAAADPAAPIGLFEAVEEDETAGPEPSPRPASAETPSGRRKRRNAMPSWDEIVFGARTEE